jgi:hypothetical protein
MQELALEGTRRMTDLIAQVAPDAEQAQAVMHAFEEQEQAYFERLREHRKALLTLNRDHDAPRESFEGLNQEINAERRAFQRRTVAALSELKSHLDEQEWSALFEGMQVMDERWEELRR